MSDLWFWTFVKSLSSLAGHYNRKTCWVFFQMLNLEITWIATHIERRVSHSWWRHRVLSVVSCHQFNVQGSVYATFLHDVVHLYDVVYLYAVVVDEMIKKDLDFHNGTDVMHRAKNFQFTGITSSAIMSSQLCTSDKGGGKCFCPRMSVRMSEPDCFLWYRMRCNAKFYYLGKIPRIGIGRPSLQRCVVL